MTYNTKKLINMGHLRSAMVRLRADYLAAIATSDHVAVRVVDTLPDAADADENVLYLVMNQQSGRYDIFKLIDGVMQDLGDSMEELADYIRKDELDDTVDEAVDGAVESAKASDSEFNEMMEETFGDESVASDDEFDEMMDEIFGGDTGSGTVQGADGPAGSDDF